MALKIDWWDESVLFGPDAHKAHVALRQGEPLDWWNTNHCVHIGFGPTASYATYYLATIRSANPTIEEITAVMQLTRIRYGVED